MDRAERTVKGYEHGFYSLAETLSIVIGQVDDGNVRSIVGRLPNDLLIELRKTVQHAPTTEQNWRETFLVEGGISLETDEQREARTSDEKRRYRKGIETLRRMFASDE
jgi:hypothetical protein